MKLKSQSYYVVLLEKEHLNPITAILYTGFLDSEDKPGTYSTIFSGSSSIPSKRVKYTIIKEIDMTT